MVLFGFPFLLALIACGVFGVGFAWGFVIIISVVTLAAFLAKLTDKRSAFVYISVAVFAALGSLFFINATSYKYNPIVSYTDNQVKLTGVILDKTQTDYGKYVYIIKTKEIVSQNISIKLRLTLPNPIDADCYDIISGEFMLYTLGSTSEKSLISYKAKGIFIGGYSFEEIEVTPVGKKPPMYYITSLRRYIRDNISSALASDEGDLLLGMTIGDKQGLSPVITNDFRQIGISHLLAVSGLHLSVWSGFIMGIFDRIKAKKRMSAIACCLFVLVFMAVTGFTFSVVRAGITVLIYLFGIIIRKEPDALNSLAASALIIGMINPFSALDPGFLLSFLATLGIILLSKPMSDFILRLTKNLKSRLVSAFVKAVSEIIGVTVAASVFTLPVNIFYFGRVCLISPVSNLIITSLATLAMILGGMGAFMPADILLFDILRRPLMLISGLICKFIINISASLSEISFSSLNVDKIYGAIAVIGSIIILTVAISVKGDLRKNLKTAVAAICCIAVLTPFADLIFNKNTADITVTDVGNGIAVVVSKGRSVSVIGCGGEYATAGRVENIVLSKSDAVNLLFIPGNSATESSGAVELLKNVKCDGVISAVDWSMIDASDEPSNFHFRPSGICKTGDGITMEYADNYNYRAAFLTVNGIGILILFFSTAGIFDLPERWISNAEILICKGYVSQEYVKYNFGNIILSSDKTSIYKNVFSTADFGNIDIRTRGNGSYIIRRAIDV